MKNVLRAFAGWGILFLVVVGTLYNGLVVVTASRVFVRVIFLVTFLLGISFFNAMVKGAREDMKRNGRR